MELFPSTNNNSESILACARKYGEIPTLNLINSNKKINLNERKFDGETILHIACYKNWIRLTEELIKRSEIDVNCQRDDGWTPLFCASSQGNYYLVYLLLQNGASKELKSKCGTTAQEYGNPFPEVIKIFQRNIVPIQKVEVTQAQQNKTSLLQIARKLDEMEVIQRLIREEVDLSESKPDGETILHVSVFNGWTELTRILLEKGAFVNVQKKDGWTPLHIAVFKDNLPLVQVLLKSGADPSIKTNSGKTPSSLSQNSSVLDLLATPPIPVWKWGNEALLYPQSSKKILDKVHIIQKGVIYFPFFTSKFCHEVTNLLNNLEPWKHKYGISLTSELVYEFLYSLLKTSVLRKIISHYFPEISKNKFFIDSCFVISGKHQIDHHTDESELTLNICFFKTVECCSLIQFTNGNYTPQVGEILLHTGNSGHTILSFGEGDRMNLVFWLKCVHSNLTKLENFPREIILDILMYLNYKTICRFSQTCKKFKSIAYTNSLWAFLWKRDFPHLALPDSLESDFDWRKAYENRKAGVPVLSYKLYRTKLDLLFNNIEYKVIISGSSLCGKTCLLVSFIQYHYIGDYSFGMDTTESYRKRACVDGECLLYDILDLCERETEIASTPDLFYRTSIGMILCFDVTNRQSFIDTSVYLDKFLKAKQNFHQTSDTLYYPFVLVGCKGDQPNREVFPEEAQEIAKKWHTNYYDTSAKQRKNVDEPFMDLVRIIRMFRTVPSNPLQKRERCKIQ